MTSLSRLPPRPRTSRPSLTYPRTIGASTLAALGVAACSGSVEVGRTSTQTGSQGTSTGSATDTSTGSGTGTGSSTGSATGAGTSPGTLTGTTTETWTSTPTGASDCDEHTTWEDCSSCCEDAHPGGVDDWTAVLECLICEACPDVCDTSECSSVGTGTCGAESGNPECSADYGGCIDSECAQLDTCSAAMDQCFATNDDCGALVECYSTCPSQPG